MEQEFFLVEESGRPSHRADDFLAGCAAAAAAEGQKRESFAEECARQMIEIKTSPCETLEELAEEYLSSLGLALRVGTRLGLRLYPLATYPLPVDPVFREAPRYELQRSAIGREKFLAAGRCAGAHLHLELPGGLVDDEEVVRHDAGAAGLRELLALYNLATALDPVLISLTRACPFYEGARPGLATRTAFYRGSDDFGWQGVYSGLPELGALQPYAAGPEDLVNRQLEGREAWVRAMERAGFEAGRVSEMSGSILDICWRPVRINGSGTVELRGIDGNYPEVVLGVVALVRAAADRVRAENLVVKPVADLRRFECDGERLYVPDFVSLGSDLFFTAVTRGLESPEISGYVDSVVEFAAGSGLNHRLLDGLEIRTDSHRTTEASILRDFPAGVLTQEEGLRLVRESCDKLEEQVTVLSRD